jgi:hypothetical protein
METVVEYNFVTIARLVMVVGLFALGLLGVVFTTLKYLTLRWSWLSSSPQPYQHRLWRLPHADPFRIHVRDCPYLARRWLAESSTPSN